MAADPLNLTRKELSEFLPSHRAIRAFEKLLSLLGGTEDSLQAQVETNTIDAGTAIAKANSAESIALTAEEKVRNAGVMVWLTIE